LEEIYRPEESTKSLPRVPQPQDGAGELAKKARIAALVLEKMERSPPNRIPPSLRDFFPTGKNFFENFYFLWRLKSRKVVKKGGFADGGTKAACGSRAGERQKTSHKSGNRSPDGLGSKSGTR